MIKAMRARVPQYRDRLSHIRAWALCMFIALAAGAAVPCLAAALPVAPGVTVEEIRDEAGPWELRVVRIARNAEQVEMVTALGRGTLSGVESLSRIIQRESTDDARVVAAVNADFFRMAHRPFPGGVSGVCVRNGELIATPRGRAGFYLTADGSPRIEIAQTSGEVSIGEKTVEFGGLNMPDQGADGTVQLFTEVGGWELVGGCLVVALENGPLRSEGSWRGEVREVIPPKTERAAETGEVLIASRDLRVHEALLRARPGEPVEITLQTEPFSEPIMQAIGGNPVLVRDGEIVAADQVRHPRTAIGFNVDEVIIVTVDGRQPGWSVGMNLKELAELMHRLGCTDAVNLDGGGSTTAWARDRIINRPSDGGARSIANSLMVVSRAPLGPPALLQVLPNAAALVPGAEIPLRIEVTDRWHNLLEVAPDTIDAEIVAQEGEAPLEVGLVDGRLSASGGPGRATVRLFCRETPEAAGRIEIEVVAEPTKLELHPADLRLLPGATGEVSVRGYAEDATEINAPAEAIRWRVEGEGIEHLGEGVFRARDEGVHVGITATLGGAEAEGTVRSAQETIIEDFGNEPTVRFRGIPASVSAELEMHAEQIHGREINFCRMTYDLGEETRTRAAYMVLNRNLGEALSLSLRARARDRTAWVRLMVTDATGASHMLTAASTLSPDAGWRRLEVRLPRDIPGPVVLQSVYVVSTAGAEASGALDVGEIRAMVVE